jgi:signal transduction histidine kinase
MRSLQIVSSDDNLRQKAIASQNILDDTRASALEYLLHHGQVSQSINQISDCLESLIGSCHTQVLSFNNSDNCFRLIKQGKRRHQGFVDNITLHTINNPQSDIYRRLCSSESSIYTDIHNEKTWRELQLQGKELGIESVWILPLVCKDNKLCGALICLFNTMRQINQGELSLIQRAAYSVSSMLFHGKQKTIELQRKVSSEKQLTKYKSSIEELELGLQKAFLQRKEVQQKLVDLEHLAALGTMMSSLTHEINTPMGVSLTASSYLNDLQLECTSKLEKDLLKRSELEHYIKESEEASFIIQRNILRATELVETFKRLSIDQDSQESRQFNMCAYVHELLLTLKPKLKLTQHKFCINIPSDLNICSQPGAISQILTNLIMNSVHHAFRPIDVGRITIQTELNPDNTLTLHYKDNGQGMSPDTLKDMYRPFFSQTHHQDSTGLGLHICNNLVMKILKGTMSCESTLGKGTHFSIRIPI